MKLDPPTAVTGPLLTGKVITATIDGLSWPLRSTVALMVTHYLFGSDYVSNVDDALVRRAYMWAFGVLGVEIQDGKQA